MNLILSAAAVAVASSAFLLDRLVTFRLPAWLILPGWLLLLPASALILWAVIALARESGASGAPFDPTRRLVRSGPYAWLRNPIYAGDFVLLIGLACVTRSPGMLLLAVLFILGIATYVRKVEEPRTEGRFGEAYMEYKQRVPRWIPSLALPTLPDRS